jgi:radical SAM superfamily enzyme YgiQ (UPF0313 family)
MVMPLGLPALANLVADRTSTATSIAHLGIEREVNPAFSLRDLLSPTPPRLLLLSLHWYPQVRPVLDLARSLRALAPESLIVLGGFTASLFAHDILEHFPCVDAVVKGDGEEAVVALARACAWSRSPVQQLLHDVPNLLWRDAHGVVRTNPTRYLLDARDSASLRHGSLLLLRHHDAYVRRALYADFSEGGGEAPYARTAYLNAGRGCSVACANCGGGTHAQASICGRDGTLIYPLPKLVHDVEEALSHGVDVLRTSFDPPSARRAIRSWFDAIGTLGKPLRLVYDLWCLPSTELLDSMARTFLPASTLILSPECGSEAVRKRVRGFPFSNDHLLRAIHAIEERGLRAHCFFSAGLPTETPQDVDQSVALIHRIRSDTGAGISVCPMIADPGSPLFLDPVSYGASLTRRTLDDFYRDDDPHRPGYCTEFFSEPQVLEACDRLLHAAGLPAAFLPPGNEHSPPSVRTHQPPLPSPSVGEKLVVLLVGIFRSIEPEGSDGPYGSQGGFVDNLAPAPYSLANGYLKAFVSACSDLCERYDVRLVDLAEPLEPEDEREEARASTSDIDRILAHRPSLVAFSTYCWNVDAVLHASTEIKARNPEVRVVLGGRSTEGDVRGLLASCPAIDAAVVGEGELAFREILRRDGFDGIAGVLWRDGDDLRWGGAPQSVQALDEIPSPLLTGVLSPARNAVMMELSRGCMHACGYCTWNSDKHLRHFGAERLGQEVAWAVRQGHQHVTLNDSAINYDTDRLRAFVDAVRRADPAGTLRFTYNVRHDVLTDEQHALLHDLPTHVVLAGIETLSPRGMEGVDRQAVDVTALRARLDGFARAVRPVVASIVLGLPGDDERTFLETLDTLLSWTEPREGVRTVEAVLVSLLQVYRGSKLWQRREQLGLVSCERGIPYLIESPSWSRDALARCKAEIIRRIARDPVRLKAAEALVLMREEGGLPVWLSPRVLGIVLRDWPEGREHDGWTLERVGLMRDTGQGALLRFRWSGGGRVRVRLLVISAGPSHYRVSVHPLPGAIVPGRAVDRLGMLVNAVVRRGEHRAAAYLAERMANRSR